MSECQTLLLMFLLTPSLQAPQPWGLEGAGLRLLDKGQRRCWTEASQQDFYLQLLRRRSTLVFHTASTEKRRQCWSADGIGELLAVLPDTIRVNISSIPWVSYMFPFQAWQMLALKWGRHIHFTPSSVEAILSRTG